MVSAHTLSTQRQCSSVRQFLIHSAFVLVVSVKLEPLLYYFVQRPLTSSAIMALKVPYNELTRAWQQRFTNSEVAADWHVS